MSIQPRISVIVPVFNCAEIVEDSLRSLSNQTFPELEIIAVNDGSTDDSGGVLDRLSDQCDRMRVIHLAANAGVHEARAAGICASRAPWIGFMDSDDFVRSDMFEKMIDSALLTDSDIVICGVERVSIPGVPVRPLVTPTKISLIEGIPLERFSCMELGQGYLWNKLYRREVVLVPGTKNLGEMVSESEDYIVNIGAFANAKRVSVLAEKMYYYYARPESVTQMSSSARAFSRHLRAYTVALEVYRDRSDILSEIDRLFVNLFGYDCYHVADSIEIEIYKEDIAESLHRMALVHPISISYIFDRCRAFNQKVKPSILSRLLRRIRRYPG